MTDAEIAGIMGWRGPGAYTKASLQKIRAIIERVCADEREACAKVCDELERAKWDSVHNALTNGGRLEFSGPMACAAAIRNRAPTHQPAPQTSGKEGSNPLTRCAANRDGECGHAQCPQLRDNEPSATGRHCPLDVQKEGD